MTKNLESLKMVLDSLSRRSALAYNSAMVNCDDVEEKIRTTLMYEAKRSGVLEAGIYILSKKEVDLLYEYNDTLTFY